MKTTEVTENPDKKELQGWLKAGDDPKAYEIGVDKRETYHDLPSGYIKSVEASRGFGTLISRGFGTLISRGFGTLISRGFGTLMQMFKADLYLGKRLKMTGCAKSDAVEDWAGFWMRVDGPVGGKSLSFDNMRERGIKGTTGWTKYQIVLDVPENSVNIAFGILLAGTGRVWVSEVNIEVVDTNVPSTNLITEYPDEPVNLSFNA